MSLCACTYWPPAARVTSTKSSPSSNAWNDCDKFEWKSFHRSENCSGTAIPPKNPDKHDKKTQDALLTLPVLLSEQQRVPTVIHNWKLKRELLPTYTNRVGTFYFSNIIYNASLRLYPTPQIFIIHKQYWLTWQYNGIIIKMSLGLVCYADPSQCTVHCPTNNMNIPSSPNRMKNAENVQ